MRRLKTKTIFTRSNLIIALVLSLSAFYVAGQSIKVFSSSDGAENLRKQSQRLQQTLPDRATTPIQTPAAKEKSVESAPSALATTNGKIVFVKQILSSGGEAIVAQSANIYAVNPDGSSEVKLTDNAGILNTDPNASLNSPRIVFTSNRDGNQEIYVMNADGTSQQRLTNNAADDYQPALSPDGSKIAFVSTRDGGYRGLIYVMNADGSNVTRLTNNFSDALESQPAWSPDGTQILFANQNFSGSRGSGIYLINADGSPQTLMLVPNTVIGDSDAAFSPDGTKIVFTRGSNCAARVAPTSDSVRFTNASYITNDATSRTASSGSLRFTSERDGNSLRASVRARNNLRRFTSSRGGNSPAGQGGCGSEIDVTNVDGSDFHSLTPNQYGYFTHPSWSPDGTKTAFSNNDYQGGYGIYVLDAGDGTQTRVTAIDRNKQYIQPSWQPALGGTVPSISLSFAPNPVSGGLSSTGTIRLAEPAPAGGTTISLSVNGEAGIVTVPASVTIAEGAKSATFNAATATRSTLTSADVVAANGNDSATATLTVTESLPDLQIPTATIPAQAETTVPFTISWTTQNTGSLAAGAFTDTIYFTSYDPTPGSNIASPGTKPDSKSANSKETPDHEPNRVLRIPELGSVTTDSLDAGQSVQHTLTVSISYDLVSADGDYYISIVTDSKNTVREGAFGSPAEGNNTSRVQPIHVVFRAPDLQITNVTVPPQGDTDVPFNVSWTTTNAGNKATGNGFTDKVYFSADNVEGYDTLLGETVVNALDVGQSAPHSISVTVPADLIPKTGDYYIYIRTDANSNVAEGAYYSTGEQNNRSTFQAIHVSRPAPDLQVQSTTVPAEAETDQPFSLAWTTRNAGNKTAGPFTETVYFSLDNQVGNDIDLGSFPLAQSLDAGQAVNRIQNLTIPTSAITQSGDYFVYVRTDSANQVDEGGDEDNNVSFKQIHVRRTLRPDLTVTSITAPDTAFFDQTIQIQWTVTNAGQGPTNASQWFDYVSIVPVGGGAGGTDFGAVANVSYLNAGESYIASATVHLPRGTNGSFNVTVRTDINNNVTEENENNNQRTRPITINVPPLPDLKVSNVQAPEEAFAGAEIPVSWRVDNIGSGATQQFAWTDAVYISQDKTFDFSKARRIGLFTHNGNLTTSQGYSVNGFKATLPFDITGNWYVFVITDFYDQVYEFTGESGNNIDYDRVQPGSPMIIRTTPPDFVVPAASAPTSANAGQAVNVAFTVRNQGAFDAPGGWTDGVYLSTDQTFSDDDTFLGLLQHNNGLASGAQYSANFNVGLPSCLNGTYYLFVVADNRRQIFEYDPNFNAEQNNASQPQAIQLTNYPSDLQVANLSSGTNAVAGEQLQVTWTVGNTGTGATPSNYWYDRVFLNTSPGVDGGTLVGTFEHSGTLAAGASYTNSQTIQIPNYFQGTYYVSVVADAGANVNECSADANNTTTNPNPINIAGNLPDLRITSVSPIPTTMLGQTINVSWTGINAGTSMPTAMQWDDRVFLSTDEKYDTGDIYLGRALFNAALASGQTYQGNIQATIPNVPVGNYYLVVYADANSNINEGANEKNNERASQQFALTAPQVDLQVGNLNVPDGAYSGQSTLVSWTVTNLGTEPTVSSSWTDYVILSRDSVYDPATDTVIGYAVHNGVLAGGANYYTSLTVLVPGGLTGDYNVFVVTDRNNTVAESNEANNVSAPKFTNLQLPLPSDLNIPHISPPANAVPGENATFEWTVQNSGSNIASGVWNDSVYLSTDTTWDAGDALVGQLQHTGTVNPGENYTATLNAIVPAIEPGNYYVIVRTDSRNMVRESNEGNNVATSVAQTGVSLRNLELGTTYSTTLDNGQERFFSINNTPANETLLVTLTGENGAFNELYTRYGQLASRNSYDVQFSRPHEANQENVVQNTQAGNYYSLVRGDYVPTSFAMNPRPENVTLKAEILPFAVRRISPEEAGNKGYTLIAVDGAKFQTGATVKLVGGGVELTPIKTFVAGQARVAALFDLNGQAAGDYQVVVTNPNGQSAAAPKPLRIKKGGGYILRNNVVGTAFTRPNRSTHFTASVSNEGLNDAISVPILIILPGPYEYSLDKANYLAPKKEDLPDGVSVEDVPFSADIDGYRVIALFAPIVRSKETVEIGVNVKFPGTGENSITVAALPAFFDPNALASPESQQKKLLGLQQFGSRVDKLISAAAQPTGPNAGCILLLIRKAIFLVLGELLPAECILQIGNTMLGLIDDLISAAFTSTDGSLKGFVSWTTFTNFVFKVAGAATATEAKCGKDLAKYAPPLKVLSIAWDAYQLYLQARDCFGDSVVLPDKFFVYFFGSSDPNDKIGPAGYGPEGFVARDQPLPYRIDFENKATATGPAQRIRVTDQLPSTLDPRTFRLTEIGFKQYRVEVPPNRAFYQTRLQLGADLNNLVADISAGLDITTGRVTWTMTALDPATGEQVNATNLGLLPPNNANNDGQGYVSYTIQPKANQPTRTNIANSATIVFDDNEPITTNTTTNLLDADVPASTVGALSAQQSSQTFTVNWAGSDAPDGSGLAGYEVWVSENNEAFHPFVTDTTATSAVFTGNYGSTYRFYSLARDNAGNREAAPDTPDATTTLVNPAPSISGQVTSMNGAPVGGATVTLSGSQSATVTTTADGRYTFANLPANGSYTITPAKTGDANGSISAYDAALVAQFAAGISSLTDNQKLAADASNNGAVSAYDAALIAQTAASISNSGVAGMWKFPQPRRAYDNLTADQTNQDFVAVLVGDVSGNWTAPPTNGSRSIHGIESITPATKPTASSQSSGGGVSVPQAGSVPVQVSLPTISATTGASISIPITVSDLTGLGIIAYQFEIAFDPNVLQLQNPPTDTTNTLSSGFTVTPNTGTPGRMIVAAFGTTALAGSDTLLKLKFNVTGAQGSTTALSFINFMFNEGTPASSTTNGQLSVGGTPTAATSNISGQVTTTTGVPLAGATIMLGGAHSGTTTTDSAGRYNFSGLETGSFYTVSAARAGYTFTPSNLSFSLVGNKTDALFTATPDAVPTTNPIDDGRNFVHQQYLDFLNREPDQGGFDYWTGLITKCAATDQKCINSQRVSVSAAFFIEQEFQDTGSFVYRFYKGSLARQPNYAEFTQDRSRVIGGTNLEASKNTFADSWTQRPEFLAKYPATLSAEQFVDALLQTIKQTSTVDLTGNRQTFINQLQAAGGTRGQVIRAVVDAKAFQAAEYNRAFVLMQYFGYLRRDPDTSGYNFWLDILNNRVPNNYRSMVCAFINSAEYQLRFSSVVNDNDRICTQP